MPDPKLIGLIELSADYRPGTWWFLSKNGFDEAGVEDVAAFVNEALGTSLTEDEVPQFLVDGAAEIDFNLQTFSGSSYSPNAIDPATCQGVISTPDLRDVARLAVSPDGLGAYFINSFGGTGEGTSITGEFHRVRSIPCTAASRAPAFTAR